MAPRRKIPHVAVLVETSRGYGRGLIRGIATYVRRHGPWSIYITPHGLAEPFPDWLRHWRGDGILARIDNRAMARALLSRKTQLPLIDLCSRVPDIGLPIFGPNNRQVAQFAFEHLRERGFWNYGVCGLPRGDHEHMDDRCDSFCELVTHAGFAAHVFEARRARRGQSEWEKEQKWLREWLLGLPKPIGIMACNDERGQHVVDACRRVGIAVPDEVAVIGVDNDQELCNLSTPALSSVEVNPERIGYEAAKLLDRMMKAGLLRPPREVRFSPSHVVTRLSTDTTAISDPIVARALRFIRDHATEGIGVEEVVRAAVTSRRYLERQMHVLLGRSPNQEILRVRIQRARLLLLETDLSLPAVAAKAGFSSHKYLGEVFVRETGQPPGEFRRQYRNSQ